MREQTLDISTAWQRTSPSSAKELVSAMLFLGFPSVCASVASHLCALAASYNLEMTMPVLSL